MENNFSNIKAPEPLNLKKSRFNINDSATAVVTFIVLNLIFSWIMGVFNIKVYSGTIWHYFLQVIVEGIFVLASFIVVKIRSLNLIEDTGMKNKISWKMTGWCALVSLVSIIFLGEITNVFIMFIELLGYESILGSIEVNTFGQYLGVVLSVCVSAAFCEELLFRGVILSGFRKHGIKTAVIASAAIFMIMHGNVEQTVHQFIVGIVVGYVFYKTGNLWIGVLIHFFNNLIPVTLTYYINTAYPEAMTEVAAETTTVGFGTVLLNLGMALLSAWVGYEIIKWVFKKIIAENNKLNGDYELVGQKTAVVIDGQETTVDMTIDGETVEVLTEESAEDKKAEPMSKGTLFMFVIAGVYLVGTWLMNTISGFLI